MLHLLVKPQLMHRCGTCCCCDTSHLIFLSSPIRALGNAIQETACVGGPDPVAGAVVPYDQKLLPTSSPTQVSGSACGPFGPGRLGIRISSIAGELLRCGELIGFCECPLARFF